MLPRMDLSHLAWPFFDPHHRSHASEFARWCSAQLGEFEADEGGDGRAAREIFQLLAAAGWLEKTLPVRSPLAAKIDLRSVCLLRELCAYSSAIADVALGGGADQAASSRATCSIVGRRSGSICVIASTSASSGEVFSPNTFALIVNDICRGDARKKRTKNRPRL
jgi:hypothetical protein